MFRNDSEPPGPLRSDFENTVDALTQKNTITLKQKRRTENYMEF